VKRVFVSDCEGPISKNDNAFEMTCHFVPCGDKLFKIISRYDDVLADVVRKPNYEAGTTLKLILPFLKAYHVNDGKMQDFSTQSLILISNVQKTLNHIERLAPAFMVSTSYEHYVRTLCHAIRFPFENTYCTRLSIDKYGITDTERKELQLLAGEISRMPMFDIPQAAKSLQDLPEKARAATRRLDEIFWRQIASMQVGRVFAEVSIVGGTGKVEAVRDIVHKQGIRLSEVMYVGDSITDEETFKLVRGGGGLTVSFNGNKYAVQNAEVAVLCEDSTVTGILAEAFLKHGRQKTLDLVEHWKREALLKSCEDNDFLSLFFRLYPGELPKVKIVTKENMEILMKESTCFRKKVRGEAVGRLG
jgi:energy-converting hydrogenase A subunit R